MAFLDETTELEVEKNKAIRGYLCQLHHRILPVGVVGVGGPAGKFDIAAVLQVLEILADIRRHDEPVRHQRLCTLVVGALTYFFKKMLASLEEADKKNAADIQEEARKREQGLKELADHFNDLKSDLPLVYTLREDFIRSMNAVDRNISGLDQKLDQVLQIITSFGKEG